MQTSETSLDSRAALWDSRAPQPAAGADRREGVIVRMPEEADITGLLRLAASGDAAAERSLFDVLYADLKREAAALMRRQPRGHTLQATGLLHEAWLRIARGAAIDWEGRRHFFAAASCAMRCVLVDHARRKRRVKRGDPSLRVPLDAILVPYEDRAGDLIELDLALTRLGALDPDAARIVEMRFFGGFTAPDTAKALGISQRTVERHWEHARAWLRREMDR